VYCIILACDRVEWCAVVNTVANFWGPLFFLGGGGAEHQVYFRGHRNCLVSSVCCAGLLLVYYDLGYATPWRGLGCLFSRSFLIVGERERECSQLIHSCYCCAPV